MRAIAIQEFGGPEKLRSMTLPRPRPAKGEVLIRVVAAGVSLLDCEIRRGRLAEYVPHGFPLVPGWDVAGVVEEFGPGAGRFRKGDRVFACARKPKVQWGCYAEYVCVPEPAAAMMPAKLLFEEAASVPLAALTAMQCIAAGPDLGPDSTVLVHAAAGGVGSYAVQLARLAGARVLGTGSGTSHPFILSLGAQAAIEYANEDFCEVLRRHAPEGADLVIDPVGGETLTRSFDAVRPGGRLMSVVEDPDVGLAERREISAGSLTVRPNGEQLERIAHLFDQKKLKTHVQKIYSLADAAEAHTVAEQRHVQGKLVLNL